MTQDEFKELAEEAERKREAKREMYFDDRKRRYKAWKMYWRWINNLGIKSRNYKDMIK